MSVFLDADGVTHDDLFGHIRTKCGRPVSGGRFPSGHYNAPMTPQPEGTKVDCLLCLGWVEPVRRDTLTGRIPMQNIPRKKGP